MTEIERCREALEAVARGELTASGWVRYYAERNPQAMRDALREMLAQPVLAGVAE